MKQFIFSDLGRSELRADDCGCRKGKGGRSAFGVFNFLKGFIHPDQAFFG